MDQLILQWISNQEANRHNTAVERETQRHNQQQEFLERAGQLNQALIAAQNRISNQTVASINAAANRYASDNARRASEYAARSSAEASRFNTRMNAWNQMQHEVTSRQANAIQERYNRGQLAIAASQAEETKRANRARELENRQARTQTNWLREQELDYKRSTLDYEKQRDWRNYFQKETWTRKEMETRHFEALTHLIGNLGGAYMRSKGGFNHAQTATPQTKRTSNPADAEGQAVWDAINEALAREGR